MKHIPAVAFSLLLGLLVLSGDSFSQQQKRLLLTDLMTPEEFRKCGLSKLSEQEIHQLNEWMLRVMMTLSSAQENEEDAVSLYDAQGNPVAYISLGDELTIYLWSGKPVAYLHEDSIYGFNGKHLGWFKSGRIYDHDGAIAGATKEGTLGPVRPAPLKGIKQIKPIKGIRELKPLRPLFGLSWSDTPLRYFLAAGAY